MSRTIVSASEYSYFRNTRFRVLDNKTDKHNMSTSNSETNNRSLTIRSESLYSGEFTAIEDSGYHGDRHGIAEIIQRLAIIGHELVELIVGNSAGRIHSARDGDKDQYNDHGVLACQGSLRIDDGERHDSRSHS